MAGRILRRFIAGIEMVVYGPPSVVSSWFQDDHDHGGHDPLAADTNTADGPDRWVGLVP
jgi:hypothetical protein